MIELHWLMAYLALGVVVGFCAGLFGIGGGGIMVPILTSLFLLQDLPAEFTVHMALATSMAAIVVTSIASLRAHHAYDAVMWPVVTRITPGILAGTFAATFIASRLSSKALAVFFASFMAYVALQMLLNLRHKPHRELPGAGGLSLVGVVIGAVSALVAIGGGSLTVPFMTWCNVKIQKAVGTSAAVGLPISVAGTVGYIVNGWETQPMSAHTLGYIHWPAVILISGASYATAPYGAKLSHSLPVNTLKRLFAILLILLCLKMLHAVFVSGAT